MRQLRMNGHRSPIVILATIMLAAVIISVALLGPATTLVIVMAMTVVGVACGERTKRPASGSEEDREAPWRVHIRRVDEAVAQRNAIAADLAWHDAYAVALGSRRWDAMVEVGDACLRAGEVAGSLKAAEAEARQAYFTALVRALNDTSLDGALRVAEAFAALADREVEEQCLRIAERLAERKVA